MRNSIYRNSIYRLGLLSLLPVLLIALAGPSSAVGPPAPQNGLVLHYAMETLVAGTLEDSAGALDGQVVVQSGSARLVTSLSGYGRALELHGTDHQYVDVGTSPVLDVNRYTAAAWVRTTGVQNDQTLDRWEVLEKANAYWVNVRTNGLVRVGGFYGGCVNANWKYLDSTRAVVVGRWTHVASTYDGTWLRVYVNGSAAGAMRVSGRTCVSTEPLAVGAKNNPTKGLLEAFWDGRLDDVRIYNRALSAAEVRQLSTR